MKQKTAIEELLSLIPSGQDIMAYIADNQPDEKMLDEWLWERIWKDRDWIGKNREQIEEAFMAGVENFSLDDVNLYYQQKYGDEKPVVAIQPNNEPRSNTNTFNDSKS